MSDHEITSVCINNTGDWISLASSTLGQLLVWEWQSETYIMKQQGHVNNMTCLSYSPDGMYVATGGLDGKVIQPALRYSLQTYLGCNPIATSSSDH
jgi:periodic tryptophan protein 2